MAYQFVGAKADPLARKGLGEVKSQLNDIAKQVFVPDYLLAELDSARARFVVFNSTKKLLNFAYITDIHINEEHNTAQSTKLLRRLAEEKMIDFVLVGGDLYTAVGMTLENALKTIDNTTSELGKIGVPVLYAPGNHDYNRKLTSDQQITNAMYYVMCQKQLAGAVYNLADPYKNYFYKDFTDENIRVFVLNSFIDNDEVCKFGATQLAWLQANLPEIGVSGPAGKNLININELLNINNYTRDDNFYRYTLPNLTPGQTYTLSVSAANGLTGGGYNLGLCDADNVSFGDSYKVLDHDESYNNHTTVTFTAQAGMKLFLFNNAIGGLNNDNLATVFNNLAPHIMIEEGDTATAYEPYIGTVNQQVIVACHKLPMSESEPNYAEWAGESGIRTMLDNYQENGGSVIMVIAGHEHHDIFAEHDGIYPIIRHDRAYSRDEEANTTDEVCFSIFTVDITTKTVKMTRVGRGEDRTFTYM